MSYDHKLWNSFDTDDIDMIVDRSTTERHEYSDDDHGFYYFCLRNDDWSGYLDGIHSYNLWGTANPYQKTLEMYLCLCKARRNLMYRIDGIDKRPYKTKLETWGEMIRICSDKMRNYIEHCERIMILDITHTWDSCELCVYLIENSMKKETAVEICRKLATMTKEQFMDLDHPNMFKNLSISKDDKIVLRGIWMMLQKKKYHPTQVIWTEKPPTDSPEAEKRERKTLGDLKPLPNASSPQLLLQLHALA